MTEEATLTIIKRYSTIVEARLTFSDSQREGLINLACVENTHIRFETSEESGRRDIALTELTLVALADLPTNIPISCKMEWL